MKNVKKIIVLEVTQRCGKACPYCFVRANTGTGAELSRVEAEALCFQAIVSGFNHVHLTGGDVLGWEGLRPLLKSLCGVKIPVSINLTAESVTAEWCSWIGDLSGDISVTLTLNGSEELHDSMRGTGSYCTTLRSIEMVLGKKIPLTLFTVVGNSQVECAAESVMKFQDLFPEIDLNAIICLTDPVPASQFAEDIIDPYHFIKLSKTVTVLSMAGIPVTVHGKFQFLHRLVEEEFTGTVTRPVAYSGYGSELFISADRRVSLSHAGPFCDYNSERVRLDKILQQLRQSNNTCVSCGNQTLCSSKGSPYPVFVNGELFCSEVIRIASGMMGNDKNIIVSKADEAVAP